MKLSMKEHVNSINIYTDPYNYSHDALDMRNSVSIVQSCGLPKINK